MSQSLERIISLAEHVSRPRGLSVVDARLSQQGKQRTIEVTIHRSGGRISLDDCETVSKELEKLLDEQDPPVLSGAYLLEVQSPGIDRKLRTEREYELFAGELVEVMVKQPITPLGAQFRGKLAAFSDGRLLITEPQVVASAKRKKKATESTEAVIPNQVQVEFGNIVQVRRLAP
jgi:ribosome maturation factor RimP